MHPAALGSSSDQVIAAVKKPETGRMLRGVILDVRNNGAGSPTEVSDLIGAFVHGTRHLPTDHGSCRAEGG